MSKKSKPVLNVASFFAGIGGFDLGLERAGMKVVFQCEINKFGQSVLRQHWPGVPLFPDIKNVSASDIPPNTELWCGGFPCQDLSLANQGKRKGLDGSRSGLFYEFARLAKERKPKWLILENVPGLLNSHQGEDFRCVLEELDELGYGVSWRILDAKYFGTPQRRRRVYIVASYRSLRSARVLFEEGATRVVARQGVGEKLPSTSARIPSKGDGVSDIYSIQHASIGRKASAGPQAKGFRNDGETYTLDSRGAADAICSTASPFRVRDSSGVSKGLDGNRYRAIGNAVCVNVIEWLAGRIVIEEAASLQTFTT
jgi:DNA (cytosine-5)-methyltransferase 1